MKDAGRARGVFDRGYRKVTSGGRCVYCGAKSTCIDHVVPLSVYSALQDLTRVRGNGIVGFLNDAEKIKVECCHECNGLAGKEVFKTLADKRKFIHEKLKEKYKNLLDMPVWTHGELEKLGPWLRSYVEGGSKKKKVVKNRVVHREKIVFQQIHCKSCGELFLPKRRSQVCCSSVCREKTRHLLNVIEEVMEQKITVVEHKKCRFCGGMFLPRNDYQSFCSHEHYEEYHKGGELTTVMEEYNVKRTFTARNIEDVYANIERLCNRNKQ